MQVLSHMQTFQMQIPAITAIPEQTLVKFRYWVKFKLDVFRYQNLYGVITGGKIGMDLFTLNLTLTSLLIFPYVSRIQ